MTVDTNTDRQHALDAQLVDLITEAVVWSGTAVERADALLEIMACAVDALRWRVEPEGALTEESSAQELLRAATEHHRRMSLTAYSG